MSYRFFLILFLSLSFLLNVQPITNSSFVHVIESSVSTSFFPLQRGFNFVIDAVPNTFIFMANAYKFKKISDQYFLELKELKAELSLLESVKNENEEFRRILGFMKKAPYRFNLIPAQIIDRENENWNYSITIDAGINKGIREGFTVISENGLVGRVTRVDKFSSKIMLITSPHSAVSVIVSRSKTFGIARGGFGINRLILDNIPEDALISIESEVVVSPASNVFIQGIPVAMVLKVNKKVEDIFQAVELKTSVDFSKIKVVFVCRQ